MYPEALLYNIFIIISIATVSLLFVKKKLNQNVKRIISRINLVCLVFTCALVSLWTFNLHLWNLWIEVIPFWFFLITSVILYGCALLKKLEKIFYGLIYFTHLILLIILPVPILGLGIFCYIYSPFIPDNINYQDKNVIVTDEFTGILGQKPSPTVYIKCGLISHKFKTNISIFYSIDSVSLSKIEENKLEIKIHADPKDFRDSTRSKEIVECNCR